MVLTTESLVADIPEPPAAMPAGPPPYYTYSGIYLQCR